MDDESELANARDLLLSGNYDEALRIYQTLIDNNSSAKSSALYNLGIFYQNGGGAFSKDITKAVSYYSQAECFGYEMATYRLAAIFLDRQDLKMALESFKKIAGTNPSAAYWVYRIVKQNSDLKEFFGEEIKYRDVAIDLGHLLAKRDSILDIVKGRKGYRQIPGGVISLIRLIGEMSKAAAENETLRYQ